jgi:hypothetical protein
MIGTTSIQKGKTLFSVPEDNAWTGFIECVRSDIYHQPGYIRTSELIHDGTSRVAMVNERGMTTGVPLLLRSLPYHVEGFDAITPYGYPCVIGEARSVDDWKSAVQALAELLKAQNIVSVFFRLHPLITTSECIAALASFGSIVYHGETVYLFLEQDDVHLWNGMRAQLKYDIRKLINAGWRFVADDWSYLPEFRKMYEENMCRVGATDFYLFSDEYYESLHDCLGRGVSLHTVIDPDGTPAASALFFRRGEFAHSIT